MFNSFCNQPQETHSIISNKQSSKDYLYPLRERLNELEIRNEYLAHLLCRVIPVQCPFERDIYWFNRKILRIPALCKVNPFYQEIMALRFRALCYLADECGKDIRCYC